MARLRGSRIMTWAMAARRMVLALGVLALGTVGACRPAADPPDADAPSAVRLRVEVVDDPALSAKISLFRGEWNARIGGELEVVDLSTSELLQRQRLTADAVIYPAHLLGELAAGGWIRPLPQAWLDSPDYWRRDLLKLPGVHETNWGGQPYAVTFGSPVLVCFYRSDLLALLGEQPPATWDEYQRLAEFFADRQRLLDRLNAAVGQASPNGDRGPPLIAQAWSGALEPLAAGSAGRVLLARAAAYAWQRDFYSTVFEPASMKPLIDTPPYVRALEEMEAVARRLPPEHQNLGLAEVRRRFLAGEAALALAWPSGCAREAGGEVHAGGVSVGFVALPVAEEVFDRRSGSWQRRPPDAPRGVPLLGIAGRLGSVARASRHGETAFRLLAWCSGPQWGEQISSASSATTLYRHSQAAAATQWVDPGVDAAAARQYAELTVRTLDGELAITVPRLPGADEYLAALDKAVQRAILGEASAAEALQAAAAVWQEITSRHGLDRQRQAYQQSLGLAP